MKNTDHSAAMHEAMHEAMLETHELISPRDLPGFVARWEADNNAPEMDADTIREALRSASDAFVDSMIQNEHDTHEEPHLAPLAQRVAKWEALRPVTRRTAELAATLAAPAPAQDPQDAPLPPDPDGMNEDRAGWARQALEHFRNVTGSDAEDALTDLLANLRHLCDREPGTYGTYEDADARAARMYAEEITPYPAPAPAEDPPARVLHLKRDPAGQWMYQTRQGDRVSIPWQYGGFDRDETIRQARDRFSFDLVAPL